MMFNVPLVASANVPAKVAEDPPPQPITPLNVALLVPSKVPAANSRFWQVIKPSSL